MKEKTRNLIWDYAHDYRDIALAQEDLGKMITEVVELALDSESKNGTMELEDIPGFEGIKAALDKLHL